MKTKRFLIVPLFCSLVSGAVPLSAVAADEAPPDPPAAGALTASVGIPLDGGKFFTGHITDSPYEQHMRSGTIALEHRIYGPAKAHLTAALQELRKGSITDERILQTKNKLAEAYLGDEQVDQAKRLFEDVISHAKTPAATEDLAVALVGLAQTQLLLGQAEKAEANFRQAISLAKPSFAQSEKIQEIAWSGIGRIMAAQGLEDTADDAFKKSLSISEHDPSGQYRHAETLYLQGMALRAFGKTDLSNAAFERAFARLDKEAKFDTPAFAAPRLDIRWEEGNPRARQIADAEYPLKYVLVNGLRIAAVPVRSEHLIAVIVSLANCTNARVPLAVGPVSLTQLSPKHKPFSYISQDQVDLTLEEQHVTDLTWRRRWLNHIQKTRYIPGYLKNGTLDPDNFFGNNQFGPYGRWATLARTETPIVTKEEFLYGKQSKPDPLLSNFVSHALGGFHPTYLDPGEAKTGLVLFQQERFDKAQLNIVVGNTIVEMPFDHAGPR